MRTESVMGATLNTLDAFNQDGVVHWGRIIELAGDALTETCIMNDGDEALGLGFRDVKFLEDAYVGDMLEYRSRMTKIGNTSRETRTDVYKLATPASRAGKAGAKPGEMVWFEQPRLICTYTVVLVVKKEQQRGIQPDGIPKDPWAEIQLVRD